jgi:spermidine synthase
VVAIAGDPRLFTYLVDSKATVTVAIGDGRLLLEAREAAAYDLLVLDAFSSDAVPVHLLTIEGLDLAMSRVRDGGVVALHVSNRYLDLEPIVAAAARDLGFVAILGATLTPASELGRAQASQWVVIGRSYRDVAGLVSSSDWRTAHAADRAPWTDRFSDLLGVLRRD